MVILTEISLIDTVLCLQNLFRIPQFPKIVSKQQATIGNIYTVYGYGWPERPNRKIDKVGFSR